MENLQLKYNATQSNPSPKNKLQQRSLTAGSPGTTRDWPEKIFLEAIDRVFDLGRGRIRNGAGKFVVPHSYTLDRLRGSVPKLQKSEVTASSFQPNPSSTR